MRHVYHAEQWLPYPVEAVFRFFANPENLPRLMPAWQKARIDANHIVSPSDSPEDEGAAPTVAGKGTRMTITFRPLPLILFRLPWDAEITEFVWNDHFCDVQLRRGPFAFWRHCHRLTAVEKGGRAGTLLQDHVEYELPLGVLGDVANSIFVARQMAYIFTHRQRQTALLMQHA